MHTQLPTTNHLSNHSRLRSITIWYMERRTIGYVTIALSERCWYRFRARRHSSRWGWIGHPSINSTVLLSKGTCIDHFNPRDTHRVQHETKQREEPPIVGFSQIQSNSTDVINCPPPGLRVSACQIPLGEHGTDLVMPFCTGHGSRTRRVAESTIGQKNPNASKLKGREPRPEKND